MQIRTDEIVDGVFRFSTFMADVTPEGLTFNQFLLLSEDPLLFHWGQRALFPLVSEAVARILPIDRLRWLSFGHVEADECGAMNAWLAAAPHAQVVNGALACNLSLNDLCDRAPRALASGEVLDLGGKRMRWVDTPQVPHGWEAGVMFEEDTRTLLSGDLFTHGGDGPAVTHDDVLERAIASEIQFGAMSQGHNVGARLRELADLQPETLCLMHGSTFAGDGASQVRGLAAWSDRRTDAGPDPREATTRLYHLSIDANDPQRVARVLAELWNGRAEPFAPIGVGSWAALAGDTRSSMIEVYPRGTQLAETTGDAVGVAGEFARGSATHFAMATPLDEAAVLAIASRECWPAKYRKRGGLFGVVEVWVEGWRMIEVLTSAMQTEYLALGLPAAGTPMRA